MLRLTLRSLQWSAPARRTAWMGTGAAAAPAAAAGVANGFGTTATAPTTGSRHRSASGGGGFGVDAQVRTDFEVRAALLKKRWRGSGQYTFARSEGQRFLDAEVPKNDLGAWMEEGNNAKALAQVLAFFEIQPEASLASLMLNKLVRVAEDESARLTDRLYAALSLISARPEENYERIFHVVAQALQTLRGPAMEVLSTACSNAAGGSGSSSGSSGSAHSATGRSVWDMSADSGFSPAAVLPPPVDEWYNAAALCAKLLQRCGRRSPPVLNEQLAAATIAVLQRTPSEYLPYVRDCLVRLYAWMVRAERPEANQVLFVLLEKVGDLQRAEFASLISACARHHLSMQLPVELIQRLVRAGFLYRLTFSGFDAAAILGSLARMVSSLVVGVNGVTAVDVMQVQNIFGALLEEMQSRLLRLMDAQDTLYWANAGAITTCVFAYELGGHHRYRRVFQAYGAYVQHAVQTLEPAHLALATGILRRAQLLNPHLAALLSARIEVVLGELRLAELSHICATFAVLPAPRPTWWDEARAVALRLLQPDTSGVVSINLAIAFPEQPGFAETVDYAQITNRQLVDVLPITLDSAQFGDAVVSTLCQRLATPAERFAPDDLQALLACAGRPQLVQAAQAYLRDAFAQPVWSCDTLFSVPLAMDHANPENNLRHFSAAKALAAAQAASVGPEQFVALAELLLAAFGESDGPIREFVQVGGMDLVRKSDVMVSTQAHYLAVLRRYATLTPPPDWLHAFAESLQEHTFRVPLSVVEDVLLSLRTLYEDVAKTPTLQIVLSALLRRVLGELMPPPNAASEEKARITVLLVYLQNGMTLPLLNASHGLVQHVMRSEAQYGPEVRRAIAMMPTPKAAPAEERRGRFVLKHLNAHSSRGDAATPVLDLNSTDPFADPLLSSELAAPPPQAPPAQPRPAAAAEASTAEPAASLPAPAPLPASEPAAVAAEAPSKAEDVDPPPSPAPPREEKPMSYYAKFFSSSVGQILVGRGVHEDRKEDAVEEATTSAPGEATALPDGGAERQPLQPRRTRLHPSAHAAAAAHPTDVADSPAPPQQQHQQQQQQQQPAPSAPVAVPVTSFTTAWGNSGANGAGAGWGFLSAASPATPVSATQQQQLQHSTAFSSLFGMPPIHTPNAAPPPSAQATLAAASAAPPAAASPARPPPPRMGTSAGMSGNNVFYNPSDPSSSSASASASLRGRPVMSRKAVITRQGVHGAAAATATEQEDIRRIYADTAGATQVPQTPNAAGGPQIVLDAATAAPAAAPPGGMAAGRTPAMAATAYRPHQQQQQQGGGAASGMTSFMHKAGVTKISGYNMDEGATDAASDGVAGAAAVSSVPGQGGTRPALDWVDAARRVGRVTRLPRSKTKTRSQHNLSAWLNTPSARLDSGVRAHNAAAAEGEGEEEADGEEAPAAAAPSHASAVAGRGRQTTVAEVIKGRRSKRKASKAADASAAAAASEAASEAGGSKRGGGAGAAGRGSRSRAAGGAAKASGKGSGKGTGGGAHHGKGGAAAAAAGAGGSAASRKKGAGKSGSGSGGGGGHAHASAGKKGAAAGAKGGKAAAAGGAGGSASRGKRGGDAAAAAVKPAKGKKK